MAKNIIKLISTDDLGKHLFGLLKIVRTTKVSNYINIALKNFQHLNATGEIAENCLGMINSGFISLQEQGDKGVLLHGSNVTA